MHCHHVTYGYLCISATQAIQLLLIGIFKKQFANRAKITTSISVKGEESETLGQRLSNHEESKVLFGDFNGQWRA